MNYYQFHIADFALHTSHLSLEEEAVYRRLLDFYYDTESPIPTETQPVIRRLRLGSHSEIVAAILVEFFVVEADGWHNLRADIEINDYHKKADRARENGKNGGRPKKNNPAITKRVIFDNPEITGSKANQEPRTKNHNINAPKNGAISINEFLKQNTDPQGRVIPLTDPIFEYAESIKLQHEYLRLCWMEFVGRYSTEPKRYRDWIAVFRKCVRGNWFKLWYQADDGSYQLTTVGKQAQTHHARKAA